MKKTMKQKMTAPKMSGSTAPSIPMEMEPDADDAPPQHEVESAVHTLTKAEEIKKNKKLMPHVEKHIGGQIKSLKGLRKLAQDKLAAPAQGDDDSEM